MARKKRKSKKPTKKPAVKKAAVDADSGGGRSRTVLGSKAAVAKHFGVAVRTVTKWTDRLVPMPGARGNYVVEDIEAWRAESFAKGKDQQVIEPNATTKSRELSDFAEVQKQLQFTKLRKENALAKQNEIKAQRMDDEFIPLHVVAEWVSEFLVLQRNLLTSIPVDMFAASPDEHRKIYQPDLKARIDIHLNHMADYIERADDLRGEG